MRKTEKTQSWVLRVSKAQSLETARLCVLAKAIFEDLSLPKREFDYLIDRVVSGGLSFLTKVLPALGKHFEACLEEGAYTPLHGIKHVDGYPAILNAEFREVFENLIDPSMGVALKVRGIRQLCYFFYKVQDAKPISPNKERAAIAKYLELEKALPMTIENDPILILANALAIQCFAGFDWDDLRAGHGPGSVADMPYARKFDGVINSPSSDAQMQLFASHDHLVSDIGRAGARSHLDYFRKGTCSEFLTVPKDSRGPRTICREPAGQQYAQQGIRRFMEQKMNKFTLTSGKVNFRDQGINQELALRASTTKEFATLDLSDASDRNTLGLFKEIFKGTAVGQAILDTRSDRVRFPSGDELKLKKLSPMGSAVCFTTLAFTVWSLLYSACFYCGRDDLAPNIYVYGDDIIVPTEFSESAIKILEHYGLKVNTSKSFSKSWFRESCGLDAYFGVVVTPVRLRFSLEHAHLVEPDTSQVASFAATATQLWESGMFNSAKALAAYLPDLPPGRPECGYIHLPEELLGTTIRAYCLDRKYKTKLDGCGRPYSKVNTYRVVSAREKVAESDISFYHRVIHPSIGSDLDIQTSSYFGAVVIPRKTRLVKSIAKVYHYPA